MDVSSASPRRYFFEARIFSFFDLRNNFEVYYLLVLLMKIFFAGSSQECNDEIAVCGPNRSKIGGEL